MKHIKELEVEELEIEEITLLPVADKRIEQVFPVMNTKQAFYSYDKHSLFNIDLDVKHYS